MNTIYRNFICGAQAVQAQSGIIFILGVYMNDGCQWYHLSLRRTPLLPGLVYPPEFLMLTSCMAGRCDYFPRHTNRCQKTYYHTDVAIGIQQSFVVVPHLSTPTRFLAFIPLSKALQTKIIQVNN